jgi:hypothetical protein
MERNSLIGINLTLTVSEPEEFFFENGAGPFVGSVVSEQNELLAIKLAEAISYNKNKFIYIVASIRHENELIENLLVKGRLSVNLVPVFGESTEGEKSASWIFNTIKRWRGGHLIGDLYNSDFRAMRS